MSKRKLLLADDSITIQKVVDLTFADEGFEVISVGDGNSALDKLREESPDLIMADVNMPGLNGYEICEKIKHGESLGDIPVILLVGSFEPFDEEEAKRVGADLHLTKPFQSINQLVDSVMELLSDNGVDDVSSNDEVVFDETPVESDDDIVETVEESTGFSGYEVDDETIQTDEAGSFQVDNVPTYETVSEVEIVEEYQNPEQDEETEADFEVAEEVSSEYNGEFLAETDADQGFTLNENGEDSDVSGFDLDDSSLLELSFIEPISDEDEDVFEEAETKEVTDEIAEEDDFYVDDNVSYESIEDEEDSTEVSAELIDQIAKRVIETMSDEDIKEVASRVVWERTDSIVREIAEEKMKD